MRCRPAAWGTLSDNEVEHTRTVVLLIRDVLLSKLCRHGQQDRGDRQVVAGSNGRRTTANLSSHGASAGIGQAGSSRQRASISI